MLLHLVVLSAFRAQPELEWPRAAMLVTVVTVPSQTAGPEASSNAARPVEATSPPAPPLPAPRPEHAQAQPRPAVAKDTRTPDPAMAEPAAALLALTPELRRHLVSRRLQLRVTVDAAGKVVEAVFVHSELPPDVQHVLERAVTAMTFPPEAAENGVVRTRLCFDETGGLAMSSEECWRPPRQ